MGYESAFRAMILTRVGSLMCASGADAIYFGNRFGCALVDGGVRIPLSRFGEYFNTMVNEGISFTIESEN